jgi:putative colanic acid biosynthesis UDP-glucose lipid carrier transferase
LIHRRINRTGVDRSLTFWTQWSAAFVTVIALLFILTDQQDRAIASADAVLAILTLLGSVPAYTLMQVYHKRLGYLSGLARLACGWGLTLATLACIGFLCKASAFYSREVLLTWAVLGYCLQAVLYVLLHSVFRHYQQRRTSGHKVLIVGTNDLAIRLADKFATTRHAPLVGLVESDLEAVGDIKFHQIVGRIEHLRDLIARHDITHLYIALPLNEAAQIEALYIDLLDACVDVVWIPDLNSLTLLNHSVSEVDGMPAIHLNESPLTSYPTAALSKAAFDCVLALLTIIVLSPLLVAIAAAIKLTSKGPLLFKQERNGWNSKVIKVWKFRSMVVHDDAKVTQASRFDARITPVGRFIRRTSFDELPQLFNVLQGRMALVGPRPHAVAHNNYYTGKIDAYMARHRIKPGITGLAQISGCRGETETIDKMQKRVELDLDYINNWSLWLDFKILVKTPFSLLSKDVY